MITIDEKKLFRSVLVSVVLLLVLSALVASVVLYLNSQSKLNSPVSDKALGPISEQEKINNTDLQVIEKVKKHMLLPSEEPKVLTLSDTETLKGEQQFFANAKDGDVILVYSQKVILYDPELDIILEVAQIKYDTEEQISTSSGRN